MCERKRVRWIHDNVTVNALYQCISKYMYIYSEYYRSCTGHGTRSNVYRHILV